MHLLALPTVLVCRNHYDCECTCELPVQDSFKLLTGMVSNHFSICFYALHRPFSGVNLAIILIRPKIQMFMKLSTRMTVMLLVSLIGTDAIGQSRQSDVILFVGGGDPWSGAEYSQYQYFNVWHRWATSRSPSGSVVFSIFADGAKSKIKDNEIQVVGESSGSPNLRVMLEDGNFEYRRVRVHGNVGPATLTTLESVFSELKERDRGVLLYFGGHGMAYHEVVEPRSGVMRFVGPNGRVAKTLPILRRPDQSQIDESEERAQEDKIREFGLEENLTKRESAVVGWFSAKSADDESWKGTRVNERHPSFITTDDLIRLREKYRPEVPFRFIATQCYAGGLAWLAFNDDRTELLGNACGIMASTYYQMSSGCDPSGQVVGGYAQWVSKGIEKGVDLDGDGMTSLSDLHFYAFANDTEDLAPQLTTEVFLQTKGYLSWPEDPYKPINEDLGRLNASLNRPPNENGDSERVCPEPKSDIEKIVEHLDDKSSALPPQLNEKVVRLGDRLRVIEVEQTPTDDNSMFSFAPATKANARYSEYLEAEQRFLQEATAKEKEAYLKTKNCELSAL